MTKLTLVSMSVAFALSVSLLATLLHAQQCTHHSYNCIFAIPDGTCCQPISSIPGLKEPDFESPKDFIKRNETQCGVVKT